MSQKYGFHLIIKYATIKNKLIYFLNMFFILEFVLSQNKSALLFSFLLNQSVVCLMLHKNAAFLFCDYFLLWGFH